MRERHTRNFSFSTAHTTYNVVVAAAAAAAAAVTATAAVQISSHNTHTHTHTYAHIRTARGHHFLQLLSLDEELMLLPFQRDNDAAAKE